MRRSFHLLISPKFFQQSREYGLFGVAERNLNQLANVRKGDICFYYTAHQVGLRKAGFIHGPFEVVSELFHNDSPVWVASKHSATKDKYPYRIKIRYLKEHPCLKPVPVQALWDLKDEGKIKSIVDSSALIDKAVCTLLQQEGILLLQSLLQANQLPGHDDSPYRGHDLSEGEVDLLKYEGKKIKELKMEAYLEAYLLLHPDMLHRLAGFKDGVDDKYEVDVLNQVSTYVAGGAIDIVCLYKKQVLDFWLTLTAAVFEVKKAVIVPSYVDQIIRYIEWATRLIPGAKHEMIKGVLIGRDFGNETDKRNALIKRVNEFKQIYAIDAFTYRITGHALDFDKLT